MKTTQKRLCCFLLTLTLLAGLALPVGAVHLHTWNYTANNHIIIGECAAEGHEGAREQSLSLEMYSASYGQIKAAKFDGSIEGVENPTVYYTGVSGTDYPKSAILPENAGCYEASASLTGSDQITATAVAPFEIIKASQTAPVATVTETTATTATMAVRTGFGSTKYGCSTTNTAPTQWQDSNVFTGLTENAEYYFFVKFEGDSNHEEAVSAGAAVTVSAHSHQWQYSISRDSGMEVLTAACEAAGHTGETAYSMLIYSDYDLLSADGSIMIPEIRFFGSFTDVFNTDDLTIYYVGTGNTVYPESTIPPTAMGTYRAYVKFGSEEFSTTANIMRAVTVCADEKHVAYGAAEVPLTYTVDGLGAGESLSGVTISREEGTAPGAYAIHLNIPHEGNELFSVTEFLPGEIKYYIDPVITFQMNGGNKISPLTVAYDEMPELPEPVRAGYYFSGWYTNSELTEPWQETAVTDNITLYAKWEQRFFNDVTGTVTDGMDTLPWVSVKLYGSYGQTIVGETDWDGKFFLRNVPDGPYNLELRYEKEDSVWCIQTAFGTISGDTELAPVMDLNAIQTVVENNGTGIMADGLNSLSGFTNNITFTAKASDEATANAIAGKGSSGYYACYDLSLTGDGNDLAESNAEILTVVFPFSTSRRKNFTLCRYDGLNLNSLTQLSSNLKTADSFYVDSDNDLLYLYTAKPGTYAIGWDNGSRSIIEDTKNYKITLIYPENGSIGASKCLASKGEKVKITVVPKTGYELEALTITNESGTALTPVKNTDGTYTITMPEQAVTVSAKFKAINGAAAAESTAAAEKAEGKNISLSIGKTNATVNGTTVTLDVAPIIRQERTMLPARFVAEQLGCKVDWNHDARTVTITSSDGKTVIVLAIGSALAAVNGEAVTLDSAAVIVNARSYVPIRFISEQLGAQVSWEANTKTVTLVY